MYVLWCFSFPKIQSCICSCAVYTNQSTCSGYSWLILRCARWAAGRGEVLCSVYVNFSCVRLLDCWMAGVVEDVEGWVALAECSIALGPKRRDMRGPQHLTTAT